MDTDQEPARKHHPLHGQVVITLGITLLVNNGSTGDLIGRPTPVPRFSAAGPGESAVEVDAAGDELSCLQAAIAAQNY